MAAEPELLPLRRYHACP